jgi:hypothetical protein
MGIMLPSKSRRVCHREKRLKNCRLWILHIHLSSENSTCRSNLRTCKDRLACAPSNQRLGSAIRHVENTHETDDVRLQGSSAPPSGSSWNIYLMWGIFRSRVSCESLTRRLSLFGHHSFIHSLTHSLIYIAWKVVTYLSSSSSMVDIMTKPRAWRYGVRIPVGVRNFSFLQNVPKGAWNW